jgi:hypothetical protein
LQLTCWQFLLFSRSRAEGGVGGRIHGHAVEFQADVKAALKALAADDGDALA